MRAWQVTILRLCRRPAVVMSLLAALLATQILPLWNPTPDGAGYLSIARSMSRGGPVTNLGSPKLHYAPGYSALVSPVFLFGERPLVLLLAVNWVYAVAFMLGLFIWARRWFVGNELWITALTMVNISLWLHARSTMSEIPFMALLIWTVNAMDRLASTNTARETLKWGALVGAMTAALAMLRPVGVMVVCGYAIVAVRQAWQGQTSWRQAIGSTVLAGTPAALATLALLAYEAQTAAQVGVQESATYLHEFKVADKSLVAQVIEGVRVRASEMGRLLVPGMFKAYAPPFRWWNINMAVYLPLVCGLAWAWWRVAREKRSALLLMSPWYLALYIIYPSDQGARYLLPLLPVLVVCLWWLVCQLPRHRVPVLSALVAAHLIVTVAYSAHMTKRLVRINAQWSDADALAEVLRGDPRRVLSWNAPLGAPELLMVAADHQVSAARGDTIPDDVDLLLASANAPDCPGFAERTRAGNLKLLERVEQISQRPATQSSR
ncbi:MAG TPA: hypothetical protein VGG64_24735 [Pirellulales bacterium]|jgi:hypothetical protein